ncbi:MAG: hypothetical protein U0791_15505 [Gemmataceae bacterium]
MRFRTLVMAAAFLAVAVPAARTDDTPALAEGNWVLSTVGPLGDSAACLISSEWKDGKTVLTVIGTPPAIEGTIADVKTDKGLSFKLKTVQTVKNNKTGKEQKFFNERVFVSAPGSSGKVILGSLGTDAFPSRAKLTSTTSEKLGTLLTKNAAFESMSTIQQMSQKVFIAKNKARVEKDKEKKKELREIADALEKETNAKLPDLFRGVVKEHGSESVAFDAAQQLLADSENAKVKLAEAAELTKLILKDAAKYGPRFATPTATRLADGLVRQKGLAAVALIPLDPIVKAMKDTEKLTYQFDVLSTYVKGLEAAGRTDEFKAVEARLAKLDAALDKEWHETIPPFKPKAFAGREDSSRVAVLELFTGAQCPPCVAADVAFDGLVKAYKPTDVVLLQYHMHIPGPDPLTNPATIARWDYYSEFFPYDPEHPEVPAIAGTPSTLFNGKPASGGGGPMEFSENKFNDYRKNLDTLLKKTSEIKLAGTATRTGDKIALSVDLKGVEAKDSLKLRLMLVEDTIKYVGGNRIRFHHQVVRAMPGGAAGVAAKDGKVTQTADVAAIRAELVKYLDEYAAKERPFPYPKIRPLEMKDLKAVALVQDDKTGEILQAVQFDVTGK